MGSLCTDLMLRSKPVLWNYGYFSFLKFQTEASILRGIKIKITGEIGFNGDLFEIKYNCESSKTKKLGFRYFCIFGYSCFNAQTAKFVYLRFPSIVWFLQISSHFLWGLEASSKLTEFYTTFWVNRIRFFAS